MTRPSARLPAHTHTHPFCSNLEAGSPPPHERDLGLVWIESQCAAVPEDPADELLLRWRKVDRPFLRLPPADMQLTGWRDPFIFDANTAMPPGVWGPRVGQGWSAGGRVLSAEGMGQGVGAAACSAAGTPACNASRGPTLHAGSNTLGVSESCKPASLTSGRAEHGRHPLTAPAFNFFSPLLQTPCWALGRKSSPSRC